MKKTIMLVEDNERLRKNMLFMLTRQGYDTVGAVNGKEALALVKEKRPDVIVSDIMMPDMDGHALLTALRTMETMLTIPVIFLTAKGSTNDIRIGMLLGADDYLVKPVDFDELLKVITTRLERHERQQHNLTAQTESVQRHLMAVLPHELRTPLSGIIGAATLIQSDIANLSKAEIVELNECILTSAKRLTRITENFLLYTKVLSQLDKVSFAPIVPDKPLSNAQSHLRDVIESIANDFSRMRDIEIALHDATLGAAQVHVERAVSEICLNAFSFSPMQTPARVASRTLNGLYIIDITNEGRGMTEEQIHWVKQPSATFVQFDREYFEQQGIGLGLALTRSIIALYGGYFDVVSDSTQTTISIGFPLRTS